MRYILFALLCLIITGSSAQNPAEVTVIDLNSEIKDAVYHIRTHKGDRLKIQIETEMKNEKKENRFTLKNVRLYRQFADEAFQTIIDKSELDSYTTEILVPSDGIYTLEIERGGMRKFSTKLSVVRQPAGEATALIQRKAVKVQVPDTLHSYTRDSVVYEYVRTSTPHLKKDTMYYLEDQIFLDVAYALRIGNTYAIPINIPYELYTHGKKAVSMKWGYIITVGNEVYEGLKKKVAQVATAAIDVGVGKLMSAKVDDVTGAVKPNTLQAGYEIFDKASTVSALAEISGDMGETTGNKSLTSGSNVVATLTGFTGLSESAGNAIGEFAPKIEDKVKWQIMRQEEYRKYLAKQDYVSQKGTTGYLTGEMKVKNSNDVYYLIIENERDVKGENILDDLEAIGKTVLSQYVYVTLKVWVQREVMVIYDKGYYVNSFSPLYNPVWKHKQEIIYTDRVIFEDEMKPYYKIMGSSDIY